MWQEGLLEAWAKPMADSSVAVGLFNRGDAWMTIDFQFADAGINGPVTLRDLWKHEDLGASAGSYNAMIPNHSVVLLKVVPQKINPHP